MQFSRLRTTTCDGPREVLKAQCEAGERGCDALRARSAAVLAGAPSRIVAAWEEVHALRAGECPWADMASEQEAATLAIDATWAWLRPPDGSGQRRDETQALTRALARMDVCGATGTVYQEGRHGPVYVAPRRCKARACLPCQRRSLRRIMDRWAPLFQVTPREGFAARFVTIGSVKPVRDRAHLRAYLRHIGYLLDCMRRGAPRLDIPPRSWVAGIRALELVPRAEGGYAHVHLYVIRSMRRYPYGYSAERLREHPDLPDTGVRALLRSLGLQDSGATGEVWEEVPVVTTDAVASYMAKVSAYMAKVSPHTEDVGHAWERADIQATLRGAHLVEAFGDARGILAGPDRSARLRHDQVAPDLRAIGPYDPRTAPELRNPLERAAARALGETWGLPAIDLAARFDDPTITVRRTTTYRNDGFSRWEEWADVATVRAAMAREGI